MLRVQPIQIYFLAAALGGIGHALCAAETAAPAPVSGSLPGSVVVAETLFPDLKPMIESAARQSLQTINANIEFLISEENVRVYHAQRLPHANGSSKWVYAQDRRLGAVDPAAAQKLDYAFEIRQPVFHWGALKASENLAKIGMRIAENNSEEAYRLLVLEVRRAFLGTIVQKAQLARTRAGIKRIEDDARIAKASVDSGRMAPAELFQHEMRAKGGRLDLEIGEENYRQSLAALERLTGRSPITDESIPTLIPPIASASEGVSTLLTHFIGTDAVKETNTVANAQMKMDQEKLSQRILSTTLRPKFNVVTGATQNEVSYTGSASDRERIRTVYAGVDLQWNIFDGFETRARVRTSKLRLRQLEVDRDEKTRQQLELVKNQVKQLEFTARRNATTETMLSIAEGYLTATQNNLKRGAVAPRDVESATFSRDDALIGAMAARMDYLEKVAAFLSAIGRDPALSLFPSTIRQ